MKTLIAVALLLVVPAFSPMPGKAAAPAGQNSANSQKDSQQHEKSAPTPAHVDPLKQPISDHYHGQQAASNDHHNSVELTRIPPVTIVKDKKDYWDHLFDWGPWIFSLFLVVVGGWQVWLLFRTLGAIKRQADTMERQESILADSVAVADRAAVAAQQGAEVANLSAKTLINIERAWIVVKVTIVGPWYFKITMENAGRTPAKLVSSFSEIAILKRGESLPADPAYKSQSYQGLEPSLITPDEGQRVIVLAKIVDFRGDRRPDQWTSGLIQGLEELYLFGSVRYLNTVGGEKTVLHETRWCFRFIPPISNKTPAMLVAHPYLVPNSYNDYT